VAGSFTGFCIDLLNAPGVPGRICVYTLEINRDGGLIPAEMCSLSAVELITKSMPALSRSRLRTALVTSIDCMFMRLDWHEFFK